MIVVGSYEAKTQLPKLIEKVEGGESVTITRHGKPVARIVPIAPPSEPRRQTSQQMLDAFAKLRRSIKPGPPSIRQLINEGRKH